MKLENMTISLEDFIKFLLKKWKIIIGVVGSCAIILASISKMFGGEIYVPHSEEYLYYERDLAWHESYLENSVLMNIDPTCIYERTILLRNVIDEEVLRLYVCSSEIWDEFETEWSKLYFTELVEWSTIEEGNSIQITVKHGTSEECFEAATYLKQKIQESDNSAEVIVCEETIVVDEKLQEEHLRWYSRIDYVNSLLLDAQAGFTLKVSAMAATVTGAFAGGILSVFGLLLVYVIREKSGK